MFLTARAVIKVIGLGKNEKIWILCANFMHTFETATFFLFLWNRFGFLMEKAIRLPMGIKRGQECRNLNSLNTRQINNYDLNNNFIIQAIHPKDK